jgi:NAD-dependent SIR2 family protein deacetylase
MTYLNCPRCKLAIRRPRERLRIEYCPRCMARVRMAVRLYEAPEPERPALLADVPTQAP